MVTVAVEGGFEIPTLVSELIRAEGNEPGARFFEEHFSIEMKEEENTAAKSFHGAKGLTSLGVIGLLAGNWQF